VNWEFHPEAREELEQSAAWYEMREPGLGDEFLEEVEETIIRILRNPETWRKIHGDVRWCLMERFPFAALYRFREQRIEIVAVAHHSRKPRYWKQRA
jgi:plasmid stabilization system protein ParE